MCVCVCVGGICYVRPLYDEVLLCIILLQVEYDLHVLHTSIQVEYGLLC